MSGTLVITDVQPQKRRKNRFNVFVNGGFWSGVDAETVHRHSLKSNTEVTQEQLDEIMRTDVIQSARNKAYNLITMAPKSEMQIREKLTSYGYTEDVVSDTINFLKSYNLVNDAELSLGRARSTAGASKPKGPGAVRRRLQRAKVAKEIVEEAIETAFQSVDLVANAVAFIKSKAAHHMERVDDRKLKKLTESYQRKGYPAAAASRSAERDLRRRNQESLVSALVRNGYGPDVAWKAVRKVLGELAEDDVE